LEVHIKALLSDRNMFSIHTLTHMKHSFTTVLARAVLVVFALCIAGANPFSAQCKPTIKIDGIPTVVNSNDPLGGLQFPYWMKEGQTLAVSSGVKSISVIEFSVNDTALEFSQVLNITSTSGETVPDDKVWKVESVVKELNTSLYNSVKYTTPGSHTFIVPECAKQVCIEVWGGGGAGGGASCCPNGGSGGGGGGYGMQCFTVTPNTSYPVVVGAGGTGTTGTGGVGGTSSVGSGPALISASGGNGGAANMGSVGTGGTSSATTNAPGQSGQVGLSTAGGPGGAAGNGGIGGLIQTGGDVNGNAGSAPGGGGGGARRVNTGSSSGGAGGAGQVIITW